LSHHPDVEQKLRAELLSKLPKLGTDMQFVPSVQDLQDLTYLDATIYELMRLFPPGPLVHAHCKRDTILSDGTFLPAGTDVGLSVYTAGRIPSVCGPDAALFKPERFIDPETGELISFSSTKLYVFSAGPRACPGQQLAIMQLKTVLSCVLSRFHLQELPGQEITSLPGMALAKNSSVPNEIPCAVALHCIVIDSNSLSLRDPTMARALRLLAALWEATQVELHGRYSSRRVLALVKYFNETSLLRAILIALVTPLPCLAATVLVDVVKLADPAEGLQANSVFLLREYASYWLMSFLGAQQFRTSVPSLPYPNRLVVANTFVVAAGSVGVLYVLALGIGFPVPFTIILGCSGWVTSLLVSLAIVWTKKLREKPEAWPLVLNVVKEWMCQVGLVVIYPTYFYAFTTLSAKGKSGFALLLPAIKLFARNVFTRTVVHLSDEMAEIVIFNAEIFNALFVSYCMQNSPSIRTTLALMAADVIQLAVSLRDVNISHRSLEHLATLLKQEGQPQTDEASKSEANENQNVQTPVGPEETILQIAMKKKLWWAAPIAKRQAPAASVWPMLEADARDQDVSSGSASSLLPLPLLSTKRLFGGGSVQPTPPTISRGYRSRKTQIALQYSQEMRRLLYMTEFLVLLNYVEVVIPLVFSIYLVAMYQLPNRMYYSQLAGMDRGQLFETLQNVMVYCSLQLLSLLVLVVLLRYKLHFSPFRQLAFVLEKQWAGVQIKLVFWILNRWHELHVGAQLGQFAQQLSTQLLLHIWMVT
ncbi:hypothetical protein BBJ28_00025193, partial [Nothophytophthora sp. Chile5]